MISKTYTKLGQGKSLPESLRHEITAKAELKELIEIYNKNLMVVSCFDATGEKLTGEDKKIYNKSCHLYLTAAAKIAAIYISQIEP